MYTSLTHGVRLTCSNWFAAHQRAVELTAQQATLAFPRPMSTEHAKGLARLFTANPASESAFLLIAWLFAARPGDLAKVKKAEITLHDGQLTIFFARGKGARLGDPYHVKMQADAAQQQAYRFLASTQGEFLVQLPSKKEFEKFYSSMRSLLRTLPDSQGLELRSMRRGRLQFLAEQGLTNKDLMKISGHKSEATLMRYLHWGLKAHDHFDSLVTAAALADVQMSGGGPNGSSVFPDWWCEDIGTKIPKFSDILGVSSNCDWLHIKDVSIVQLDEISELARAVSSDVKDRWEEVRTWLSNPKIPPPKTHPRTTKFRKDWISQMVAFGHATEIDPATAKAFIHLFGVQEVQKDRTRSIKHPERWNELITKEDLIGIKLPTLLNQCGQVAAPNGVASYAEEYDASSFFDSFEVDQHLAAYQCFMDDQGKCYKYNRMMMGVRWAVDVAQCAMDVVATVAIAGSSVSQQTNVDNVRFVAWGEDAVEAVQAASERFFT